MFQLGKNNPVKVLGQLSGFWSLQLVQAPEVTVDVPVNIDNRHWQVDEHLNLFAIKDREGYLSLSTIQPVAEVGQLAVMKAVSNVTSGAYFDWGLSADLFVPNKYLEHPVSVGLHYPVFVTFDAKKELVLGATRLHKFMPDVAPNVTVHTCVKCMAYAKSSLGYKIVVDNRFLALLFHSDVIGKVRIGESFTGYIKQIREDGKIDISMQPIGALGRSDLENDIIDDLIAHGGISTLTDKSPAETIYARYGVSKAAYKKAIGRLFKQQRILITKEIIKLNQPDKEPI